MATVLFNKEYDLYDESKNLPLNKIYVKRGASFVPLTNLFIQISGSPYKVRKIKNFEDFKNNRNNLSYSNTSFSGVSRGDVYSKTLEFTQPNYATEITKTGATKFLKQLGAGETFKYPVMDDKYALIFLKESVKPRFAKLSEIYYYDGLTRVYLTGKYEAEFAGKELFLNGKPIKSMLSEKQYTFENYKFKIKVGSVEKEIEAVSQEFDPTTRVTTVYEIEFDESGAPVLESDGTVKYKSRVLPAKESLVTHDYVTKTVDDDKNPGKTKEESMVAVKKYNYNADGKYIQVQLKDKTLTQLVRIADIKDLSGAALPAGAFDSTSADYILGKSVKVTINGVDFETEPLTLEQLTMRYNSIMHFEDSLTTEDVLTDDAYLMLNNGKHVKEKDVIKPFYYKTLGSAMDPSISDFDVYVATVTNKEGIASQVVLNKEYFENSSKGKTSPFILDGYTIDISKVSKAKRVAFYSNCDVVQTTSSGKNIESCKIYTDTLTRDNAKADNLKEFEKLYKAGNYNLDSVYVYDADAGTHVIEELDSRKKRFIYTDASHRVCHSDKKMEYRALEEKPFIYKSENGEIGKITGGPKYDIGKGIAKDFKTWGKVVGSGANSLLSSAGILVALAFPAIVTAAVAAAVVAPVLIPIAHISYGVGKNTFNKRKWTKPDKYNENEWRNEITKHLEYFKTQTLAVANNDINKAKFFNECDKISAYVQALLSAHVHDGFEMIDGECKITTHNAHAATRFMAEAEIENAILKGTLSLAKKQALKSKIKKLKKKLEKGTITEQEKQDLAKAEKLIKNEEVSSRYLELKKKLKKGKTLTEAEQNEFDSLEIQYSQLADDFKEKMTNYKSEPFITEPEKKSKQIVANAETLKAFLYLKQFTTDTVFTVDGVDVTIDRTILKTLDYDFVNNVFVYYGKHYSYETGNLVDASEITSPGMSHIGDKEKYKDVLTNIKKVLESKELEAEFSKPAKVNTDYDLETRWNNLLSLAKECDALLEAVKNELMGLNPADYKIVEELLQQANYHNNIVKSSISSTDINNVKAETLETLITSVEATKEKMENIKESSTNSVSAIKEIEATYRKFSNKKSVVYGKLVNADKALSVQEKDYFELTVDHISDVVEREYAEKQTTTQITKLQSVLSALNAQLKEIDKLSLDIDNQATLNSKAEVVKNIQEIIISINNSISQIGTPIAEIKMYTSKIKAIADIVNGYIKEVNASTTTLKQARILSIKAEKLKQLIDVAVSAGLVVAHLKSSGAKAEDIAKAATILGKIEALIAIKKDISIDEILEKIKEARSIYEKELMPYLNVKIKTPKTNAQPKTSAPSKTRASSISLVSENSLVQQLEDSNSEVYKYLLKGLQRGKYKLTEKDAKAQIDKFINAVNEAHNTKKSAKSIFEVGTIERDILNGGLRQMKKLITIDY